MKSKASKTETETLACMAARVELEAASKAAALALVLKQAVNGLCEKHKISIPALVEAILEDETPRLTKDIRNNIINKMVEEAGK